MINRRKFIGLTSLTMASTAIMENLLGRESLKTEENYLPGSTKQLQFPEFDLYYIPFSCAGSYHTINKKTDTETCRLVVNTVRRSAISYKWQRTWANNLFEIALFKEGQELNFTTKATPWNLQMQAGNAEAVIAFADPDTLVVQTKNCGLQLIPYRNFSWKHQLDTGKYVIYDNQPNHYYYLQTTEENNPVFSTVVNAGEELPSDIIQFRGGVSSPVFIRMITEERKFITDSRDIHTIVQQRKKEIDEWMYKTPASLPEYLSAVRTGWYLFWNLQVAPWGNYSRQTVLSSKKSMSMIWSWDICFNALALVRADHRLAWDQLFSILDQQKENGLLPDVVSDLNNNFGFNKPPVWGWTIMKMLPHTPKKFHHHYIKEVYPKIVAFTQWWYANRDLGKRGVCAYMHGNDSGWDNATIFDSRSAVESPDLTAFLILQAESLEYMAGFLGKETEAVKWANLAKEQLALFKKIFINQDHLKYWILSDKGPQPETGDCLLTRIPLILGNRLPEAIKNKITSDLSREDYFLTPYGLASEAVTSSKYQSNGYWRGPVWAPSTYLIFEGLLASGNQEIAQKIARRFCDMVAQKSTFHENYNALTGLGQYDSGLTWTASDFLLMSQWLAERKV